MLRFPNSSAFQNPDWKLLVANQERLMDNLSAEERFEKFCIKYPILQYLKTDYSYIGVTPEFFSKMKSKLLRK
jgi:hypothetical protein